MFEPLSSENRSEWAEKIRRQRNSGLNATSWCRKHQIAHSTFVYWKDCLSSKASMRRSSCIEPPDTCTAGRVSIEYQDVRIHLDKDVDLATLKNCLSALRKTKC
jgi:hypothetical protein